MESTAEMCGWQLDERDPLHTHLALVVLPRAGIEVKHPDFEVSCLGNGQEVYRYRERKSRSLFVCKFFGSRWYLSETERRNGLNYEFKSLNTLRKMGFCEFPHRVVRPLSKDENINCLLVEEFVLGHNLDYYIAQAAYEGQHERLFQKLTELAHFLGKLHARTANSEPVNFASSLNYFRNLVESLARKGIVDPRALEKFVSYCDEWDQAAEMWADVSVLVHGDATPTNFIFHPEYGITAIDLERMQSSDRVYDIGILSAELKHHFAWRIFEADAAEPFIRHFLKSYCERFLDPESVFDSVACRNRFYMALGELRIARNDWLSWEHRKWLVDEAHRCLRF